MGSLREIVDAGAVGRLFLLLAIVGPIIGAALGAAIGARQGWPRAGMVRGLLFGMLADLNWLLWRVYNTLTDQNGLDSVKNLVLNLVLFVVVGVVIGVGFGWATTRRSAEGAKEETLPNSSQ